MVDLQMVDLQMVDLQMVVAARTKVLRPVVQQMVAQQRLGPLTVEILIQLLTKNQPIEIAHSAQNYSRFFI